MRNPRNFTTPLTIERAVQGSLDAFGDPEQARGYQVAGERWGLVVDLRGKELEVAMSRDTEVQVKVVLYTDSMTSQIKNDWIITNRQTGEAFSPLYTLKEDTERGLCISVFAKRAEAR